MAAGLADFTPFHSLAGGLMMAASLHTLLSKLGLVLGISGFFHSTVSSTLGTAKEIKSDASTSIFPLVARYFTSGIFLGGLVLGLARPRIEAGLGVPILDSVTPAKHTSLLSIAALGALVGFGTKVSTLSSPLGSAFQATQTKTLLLLCVALLAWQWLHFRSFPLWSLEALRQILGCNCNLLWRCRSHSCFARLKSSCSGLSGQVDVCQPVPDQLSAA